MNSPPVIFMYIGNLEPYQGVDLLIDSFALHHRIRDMDRLIIIGGLPADVEKFRRKAGDMGLSDCVDFRGHRPVSMMKQFFREADVLVSPRIKGINTPMKIYSYLDAGKAVLATNLITHTQVLDATISVLAMPVPEDFAKAMLMLAEQPMLRQELGRAGREIVRQYYSKEAFKKSLDEIYDFTESYLKTVGNKHTA